MGTTSTACATQVLDCLDRSGAVFAILHKAEVILGGGPLSDLDVVVNAPPTETIAHLAPVLRQVGLRLIATWPYDTTGLSAFISNDDATQGAQLDLTFDPNGLGKYGFRSTTLLEHRAIDGRWPRLDQLDELLYLVRKRQVKGDWEALSKLSADPMFGTDLLRRRGDELFARTARPAVRAILRGEAPPRPAPAKLERKIRTLPRYLSRAFRPIGFWVDLPRAVGADEIAEALAARFGKILSQTRWGTRPTGVAAGVEWFVRDVAPIRWRAGLFVSVGNGTRRPRPDLRLDLDDLDDLDRASRAIVAAMADQRGAVAS